LLQIRFGSLGAWGTALLIDERCLLTCAHNVFSKGQAAVSASFHRAYNSEMPPVTTGVEVDCAFIKRVFKVGHDRTWDIAVLRLAEPIYKVQPLRLGVVTEHQQPDPNLTVAGYPGSRHYRMWEEQELVRGVAWQINVRMRLFQAGLAFKDENPSDGIVKTTAIAKTPPIGMYG